MRYHLFQKFFGKMVKIKETSFLSTRGAVCFALNCTTTLNCTYLFIYPTHPPDYRRKDKHLSLQNPLLSVKGVGICPNVAGAAISD